MHVRFPDFPLFSNVEKAPNPQEDILSLLLLPIKYRLIECHAVDLTPYTDLQKSRNAFEPSISAERLSNAPVRKFVEGQFPACQIVRFIRNTTSVCNTQCAHASAAAIEMAKAAAERGAAVNEVERPEPTKLPTFRVIAETSRIGRSAAHNNKYHCWCFSFDYS